MKPPAPPSRVSRAAGWLVMAFIVGFGLRLLVDSLFFYPDRTEYLRPEHAGAVEYTFASLDGTRLHGWFVPASTSNAIGTVVHYHGNAQNLTAHYAFVDWLPAEGFHVFAFDYRGYGKSDGSPTRPAVLRDAQAALRFVRTLPGVDTNRILLLGQSLGGAMALAAAGSEPDPGIRALVIDSSFYSYPAIIEDNLPGGKLLLPVRRILARLLTGNDANPSDALDLLAGTPLLFLHGERDRVIPPDHSRRLFADAHEPKRLLMIERADHIEALQLFRAQCAPEIASFFRNALEVDAQSLSNDGHDVIAP